MLAFRLPSLQCCYVVYKTYKCWHVLVLCGWPGPAAIWHPSLVSPVQLNKMLALSSWSSDTFYPQDESVPSLSVPGLSQPGASMGRTQIPRQESQWGWPARRGQWRLWTSSLRSPCKVECESLMSTSWENNFGIILEFDCRDTRRGSTRAWCTPAQRWPTTPLTTRKARSGAWRRSWSGWPTRSRGRRSHRARCSWSSSDTSPGWTRRARK